VPLRLLPEGQYLARATIMVGGQRVGAMTRRFHLERPGGQ
jgi:hypothetical protein